MVQVALLGAGLVSRYHVGNMLGIPGVRIVAAADRSTNALDALDEQLTTAGASPAKKYTSCRALLDNETLDAVLVLLPHDEHAPAVRAALEADLHVLCEKPLATSTADAEALVELARERQRLLYVSYQIPLLSPYRYLLRKLETNALGELLFIDASLGYDWRSLRTTWRHQPGAGILWDGGNHFLDLIERVSGGVESVACQGYIDKDGVCESLSASFRMRGGRVGSLALCGRGPFRWHFSVIGARGSIAVSDMDRVWHFPLTDYAPGPGIEPTNVVNDDTPMPETETPDETFIVALRDGNLYASNARHAVRICRLVDALLAAHREGTEVEVSG